MFCSDSINYDYVVLKFPIWPHCRYFRNKDGFTFRLLFQGKRDWGLSGGGGSTRAYVISIANPDTGEYILTANLV